MQHPSGYRIQSDGSLGLVSLRALLLNPWAWVQLLHNQMAALVTGSFVVTAIGAFYTLRGLHPSQARLYLRAGTLAGLITSVLVPFPTGDQQAKMVGRYPASHARCDGRKVPKADLNDRELRSSDNRTWRCVGSTILSKCPAPSAFSPTGRFNSYVHGLDEYPGKFGQTTLSSCTTSFQHHDHFGHTFHRALWATPPFQKWRGGLETTTWVPVDFVARISLSRI